MIDKAAALLYNGLVLHNQNTQCCTWCSREKCLQGLLAGWPAAAPHLIDVLAHAYAQAVAAPDAPARAAIKHPVALAGAAGLDTRPLLPASTGNATQSSVQATG